MFVVLLDTFLLMLLYYEILAMTLGRGNSVTTDTTQLVIVPLTKKNLQNTMWNVGYDAILPGKDKTVQVNIIQAGIAFPPNCFCQSKLEVRLYKPVLWDIRLPLNIQATMCSYGNNLSMWAYGSENTPHWPDVPHCTNTVIIGYKLNHSHKGTGSKPLSGGK